MLLLLAACSLNSCSERSAALDLAPSDDPADYDVDTSIDYQVQISEPRWVIPSEALPVEAQTMSSNANVDIIFHADRLFMAWRTAPNHFASDQVYMLVVSSLDGGETWEFEHLIDIDSDLREPRFLSYGGELQLIFFQAGTEALAFEPITMWRTFRHGPGDWSELKVLVDGPEVPWDVKVRGGIAYMTSYRGEHYSGDEDTTIQVFFKYSTDGDTWNHVDDRSFVYEGGVSEAAFEFDEDGSLWVVTRNEDGDETGYGSHVCWAPAAALASWECPATCDPERYDSPELFRHGDDIYLIARRDIGGPYGEGDATFFDRLLDYSKRPKGTALYQIDKASRSVVHLMDLPGVGDTSFPSVRRTGTHTFLVANYTSPLDEPDISWIEGQISERGTQIYLLTLSFVPEE